MKNNFHKIGAIFFLLWGIIHVMGGGMILAEAYSDNPKNVFAMLGPAAVEADIAGQPGSVALAIARSHAFNIVWFGFLSIIVALKLNWKNSRVGFWINLSVVGLADVGLILFQIMPGYMSWSDGFIGPLLLIPAAVFCWMGLNRMEPLGAGTVPAI